ncbi:MAG: hypothetical protein HY318_02265, partial [Armatimonadetes bacterium]|nr:hypothetical protein [Armatimonadota bacterium]
MAQPSAHMNHAPTPSNRFALTATRIFDGEKVLTGHAVLVEEGIVRSVVPIGSLPGDVQEVYDEPDSTITPGLIDTHTHFMRWEGPLFLACGVTTIRDTGNDLKWILERRSEGAAHPWPRILCMGPLLDGPTATHPVVSRACADLEDAVGAVRETVAAGVDGVKLYVGLETEWLPAMVRE